MQAFSLEREQEWDLKHHVEKILAKVAEGDVTVACWEPGQINPYHCHPQANLFLLFRRRHDAHADRDYRSQAWRLCCSPAGRSA
jgi:hypothetical protein